MSVHEIKLASRNARLKLNNNICRVIVEKPNKTVAFVTKPRTFQHDGVDSVRVVNEHIIVPITDITKIEMPVSRFTPDKKTWMEVDW